MRALRDVYTALAEDARQEAMSPAAEWLLDNFHIISAAARDIHHDLPPSFFRRLPRVAADEFAGLPRIYALALELIGSSAGRLDAQRLQRFISAFQSVTPLTIGELWAWPSALKLALIDHLRVRARRARRRRARIGWPPTGWPPALEAGGRARSTSGRPQVAPRVRHAAAAALARPRRVARPACTSSSTRRWRRASRPSRTRSAPKGSTRRPNRPAMANLIGSLRLISTFDWSEFFESVSLVEQVLQRDPAGVYGRMDFRSRDRYRHAVEELAEPTGEGQLLLALKSVERARQVHVRTPDARGAHVGYHLIGGGRRAVRAQRRLAAGPPAARSGACSSRGRRPAISGRIAAGTALLVARRRAPMPGCTAGAASRSRSSRC